MQRPAPWPFGEGEVMCGRQAGGAGSHHGNPAPGTVEPIHNAVDALVQ